VLEPQPFASYKDSARLSDELRTNFEILRDGDVDGVKGWREEDGDFERVLVAEVGFDRRERLGETGKKGQSGRARAGRLGSQLLLHNGFARLTTLTHICA